MNSRVDKYYESENYVGSRTKKNQSLYDEINNQDLDDIDLSTNAQVIGDNDNNIDINKIKELLEKRYYETPKRSSFSNKEEIEEVEDDIEVTKEYDINSILEKARLEKEVDYEKERLKKIHDTQYDILKNLDLDKTLGTSKKEENLIDLINAINEKEKTRDLNPLDILEDLKGSENTVVLEGIKDNKEPEKKEEEKSFYTNSLSFTQSDFDDFNDLKEDVEYNKVIIRILIAIIVIGLLVGLVFLILNFLNIDLF